MAILLQVLHILAVLAVAAALIYAALGLQDVVSEVGERIRNALDTRDPGADELAGDLAALDRQLRELRSLVNDVDERTENRWKRIAARDRRAQRRDVQEEEEEGSGDELPAGFDPRQFTLPIGGAPNGQQPPPQRMVPASHLFRR